MIEMSSEERDRRIVQMRRAGATYREIGKKLGMSINGVRHALVRIQAGRPGRALR